MILARSAVIATGRGLGKGVRAEPEKEIGTAREVEAMSCEKSVCSSERIDWNPEHHRTEQFAPVEEMEGCLMKPMIRH